LRNGEIEIQRDDSIRRTQRCGGRALVNDTMKSLEALEKRCEDPVRILNFYDAF